MDVGLSVTDRTMCCRGHLLDLTQPRIMGIVNLTPDSFYDGGQMDNEYAVWSKVEEHIKFGAKIIDVGAASSRPGAQNISADEEWDRIKPYAKAIVDRFPDTLFSIDTTQQAVAQKAMDQGWHMINDVSNGGEDKAMWKLAKEEKAGYIMMHMQGNPGNMQENPKYTDVVQDVLKYFVDQVQKANKMEFYDYCIDIGFGFGKRIEQNYELLKNMHVFDILDRPLLAGLSRKSMIYRPLNLTPEEALNGTSALHMIALQQGTSILRVHDVKEAQEVIDLYNLTYKA